MPLADPVLIQNHDRLEKLHRLELLDTGGSEAFDRLTWLASRILRAPVSLVSLIDAHRNYLKSHVGLGEPWATERVVPLEYAYCAHVVALGQPLVVEDARLHPLLHDSPSIPDLGALAYAGMPLITSDGYTLGALCVIDVHPRHWTEDELEVLYELSLAAVTEIELQGEILERRRVEAELRESQRFTERVVNTLPDIVYVFDLATQSNVYANREMAQQFGYSAAEVQQMGASYLPKHIHPDDLAHIIEHMTHTSHLADDDITTLEYRLRHRDGSYRWLHSRESVFKRDDTGRVLQIIGVAQDITARRQAEEALLDNQRFVESIVHMIPDVVYVNDLRTGSSVYSNRELAATLGYTTEEVAQMGASYLPEHVHTDDLPRMVEFLMQAANSADGETREIEYRIRHRDGTYHWLHSRETAFQRDGNGRVSQMIGVAENITQRKQIEQELLESQRFVESIVHSIPDILYIYDVDKRHNIYANERLTERLGYTLDEMAQMGEAYLPSHLHPDDAERMMGKIALLQTQPDGEILQSEYRFRTNTGAYLWLNSRDSVFRRDATGRMTQFIGISQDITARKEAEHRIAQLVNRLHTLRRIEAELSETLDLGMVLTVSMDAILRITGAEHGCIALNDGDALKVVQAVGGYTTGMRLPSAQGIMARVLANGVGENIPDVSQDADYLPLIAVQHALMLVPLIYRDRTIGIIRLETRRPDRFSTDAFEFLTLIAGRITAAIDNALLYNTSQEQLHDLTVLYQRVSDLEQIKTDMIRIAAHDLRNPLGVILGYSEMMLEEAAETLTAPRDWIETVARSGKKMQKMVTDILSLERIQAAHDAQETVSFDFAALVRAAAVEHEAAACARQQQFTVHLPDGPMWVRGHSAQLQETVDNLIGNAIKYTPDGGTITVALTLSEDGHSKLRFEVTDTGYGIPADQQDKLFKPFFRAQIAETREIEGTGLGLHLVKNMIERHGGQMRFTSTYGRGSSFGFELPLVGEG